MALYNGFTTATDPAGGRDSTQFYAFDGKSHADAINAHTDTFPSSGTFASRPAAGLVGRLYYAQDNDTLYRDNGAAWDLLRLGGDSCDAMGTVPSTGWTAVNMQSGASWAADKDAMLFTAASTGSADNVMYQYRAYPTPPFTLTAYIGLVLPFPIGIPPASKTAAVGLCISDGTKIITLGYICANSVTAPFPVGAGIYVGGIKWTNATTFSAQYNTTYTPVNYLGGTPKWFRFQDDGANRTGSISLNGIDWIPIIASETRTTFLTPTRIGVSASNFTGSTVYARVRSWNGVT